MRNIINERQATLYVNYIDFDYGSIHKNSFWKIMKTYSISGKLISLISVFYYMDLKCSVIDKMEKSELFDVKTGVKQGYNMADPLFMTAMNWIMRRSMQNGETGIRWNFNMI